MTNDQHLNTDKEEGIKYRMGRYIKTNNDQCILEEEIASITFDGSIHSFSDCVDWLDKRNILPLSYKTSINGFSFGITSATDINNSIEMDTGVIARCAQSQEDNKLIKSKEACSMEKLKEKLTDRPNMVYSHSPLEIVEKAGDDFTIEGFASTGEIDRDFDVVDPMAFKNTLGGFMENPILCYMHNWLDPIGKILDARVVGAGEEVRMASGYVKKSPTGGLFIRASISKTADKIRTLIKEGNLKAFSIGFMIKDADFDDKLEVRRITDIELFEISVVSIPSNRRSLFSLAKALRSGTDLEEEIGTDIPLSIQKLEIPEESMLIQKRIGNATKSGILCLKGLDPDEAVKTYSAWIKTGCTNVTTETINADGSADIVVNSGNESKEIKQETLSFEGKTSTTEGEGSEAHTHDFTITVERDDNGFVTSIDGITTETDVHSHPIREMGKTETVDGHYHTFKANLETVESEPKDDDESTKPEAGEEEPKKAEPNEEKKEEEEVVEEKKEEVVEVVKEKQFVVPQDIMDELIELLLADEPDQKKLEKMAEYLCDVIETQNIEDTNVKYYLKQIKDLLD